MLGIHFIERELAQEGFGVSIERVDNHPHGELCVVIDPTAYSAIKLAFAALATTFAAVCAPVVFGVMFTVGYFLKQSFEWIVDEIMEIWHRPSHYHEGDNPCRDRQVILGITALAVTCCFPPLTAGYSGLYLGGLANWFAGKAEDDDEMLSPEPEVISRNSNSSHKSPSAGGVGVTRSGVTPMPKSSGRALGALPVDQPGDDGLLRELGFPSNSG